MNASPIAPAWAVLPLAAVGMLVVAAYILAIRSPVAARVMPPARRRIRTASAWVSIVTIPLLAAGFALIPPAQGRTFVLVWAAGTGLIAVVLVLAMLDLADTWRIRRAEHRRHARDLARARAQAVANPRSHRPLAEPPDAR